MYKLLDWLGSLLLFWQPVYEKENSEFKPNLLRLKNHILLIAPKLDTYIPYLTAYKAHFFY